MNSLFPQKSFKISKCFEPNFSHCEQSFIWKFFLYTNWR